jgi:hypothetical protein
MRTKTENLEGISERKRCGIARGIDVNLVAGGRLSDKRDWYK